MTFFGDKAYNPSVINTRLSWISFVCGLTMGSVFVGAETKLQNAPTPPPGYETRLEILVAFGNGKLEIVERNLPLTDDPGLEGDSAGVNIYGVYDMTTQVAKDSYSVNNFLQGKSTDEAPELDRQSSPRFHLDKTDPSTLILLGTIDQLVPIAQADTLTAYLKRLKIPHSYGQLDGWPHTMDLAKPVNDFCQAMVDRFFANHIPLPEKKNLSSVFTNWSFFVKYSIL